MSVVALLLLGFLFTMWTILPSAAPRDTTRLSETPVSLTPEEKAYGQLQFKVRCTACHGMQGEGTRQAPPLNDAVWSRGDGSVGFIAHTISNGIPGTTMPAWKDKLLPKDIQAIAGYVHWLSHPDARAQ
jgi:mono/diheme cytochrome c family protein